MEGRGAELWVGAGSGAGPGLLFLSLVWAGFSGTLLTLFTAATVSGALTLLTARRHHLIWAQATGLGSVFSLALLAIYLNLLPVQFNLYVAFFTLFHWAEFMATALWNGKELKATSFLLNHSLEYWIAAVASWTEFWIEHFLFCDWKRQWALTCIGCVACAVGECIRLWAMQTAGRSFNHLVQDEKGDEQRLVQEGPYACVRHPAYTGWFLWSVGTQIVLVNPLCTVAYTLVVWRFFSERILQEEFALVHNIFGTAYLDYQRRVHSGIPFVQGYVPLEEGQDK